MNEEYDEEGSDMTGFAVFSLMSLVVVLLFLTMLLYCVKSLLSLFV